MKNRDPSAERARRVHPAHLREAFPDLPVDVLDAVRCDWQVERGNRAVRSQERGAPHHAAQPPHDTPGTIRVAEERTESFPAPLCLRRIRRLKKHGHEPPRLSPDGASREPPYAPEFRHPPFHVHVAPLEVPVGAFGNGHESRESVSNHRNNAASHLSRQLRKHPFPVRHRFPARQEAKHDDRSAGFGNRTEKYGEAPPGGAVVDGLKPEHIHDGDERFAPRFRDRRGMRPEPCGEAPMELTPHPLSVATAGCGDAPKRGLTPQHPCRECRTRPETFASPSPGTHGPRFAAGGAPPAPRSVGRCRSSAAG